MILCIVCEEEIDSTSFMIGIDRPYCNAWFHRDCKSNTAEGMEFLKNNSEIILRYAEKWLKMSKK